MSNAIIPPQFCWAHHFREGGQVRRVNRNKPGGTSLNFHERLLHLNCTGLSSAARPGPNPSTLTADQLNFKIYVYVFFSVVFHRNPGSVGPPNRNYLVGS